MSGLTLLAPIGLVALIALPLIVLLYMRTTTPTERSVPSIRFWRGAETAPTEHQRFRMPPLSLLLIAHLAIAGLLAFALAQPASARLLNQFASRSDPVHLIVVIDGSTSMASAVDPLGSLGRSHFDLALKSAQDRLAGLGEGDSATVLIVGTHTTTYQASDAAEIDALRSALGTQVLPGGQADFNAAMRLCRDLVVPGMRDEIVIISDGAEAVDPALVSEQAAPVTFEQIESQVSTNNVAITELTATGSTAFPGRQDMFARIINFGDRRVVVSLTISADDIAIAERSLTIDPGTAATVTQLLPEGAQIASALISGEDALVADNVAQVSLAESGLSGTRMLLVSDAPSAILKALSAIPGSQVETRTRNQFLASGTPDGIDLLIVEGELPTTALPAIPALIIHPGAGTVSMSQPVATRIQTQDPVLSGVELAGVTFGEVPVLSLTDEDVELVGSDGGPLIYRSRTSADQPSIVLAFDITQTNLPVRVAFPILVANIVSELASPGLPPSLSTGEPMIMPLTGDTRQVLITLPDGSDRTIEISATEDTLNRRVTFGETGQPGIYQVQLVDASGAVSTTESVIVNAGHPQESNLTPNPLFAQALETPTQAQDSSATQGLFDLWPLILAGVLALLVLEWLYTLLTSNRRTLLKSAGGSAP